MCCTFSNICVDGYYVVTGDDGDEELLDKRVRHVVEFDGCYWHACSVCGAGPKNGHYGRRGGGFITREKKQIIKQCRYDILEKRGYIVHRIRECEWNNMRRDYPTIDEFCKSRSRKVDPLVVEKERSHITTSNWLLRMLKSQKVFGILVCDIKVPTDDGGKLRQYFQDFAPIIKHAVINYQDIGEFMQNVSDKYGIKVKDRRCVIDSYFGKRLAIIDEYMVWLLKKDSL